MRSPFLLHELGGWNDEFVVYTDVLVEQVLKFLVLVVELASLVDQLLPGLKEVVVFGEGLVEDLPDAESAFG